MKLPVAIRRGAPVVVLAALLAGLACSSSSEPNNNGGGTNTGLTVSNATPASGNGALTGLAVVVDTQPLSLGNAAHLVVTGSKGGVNHHVEIYVLLSDNTIPLVEHTWGTDLLNPEGFTVCSATGAFSACAASQYSANVAALSLSLNGLVLGAATGDGDTSTLTGSIDY